MEEPQAARQQAPRVQQNQQGQQVRFALSPAAINNEIIDYSTAEGMKLYNKAIAPLSMTFGLEAAKLNAFIQLFRARADSSNWWPALTFIQDGETYNLVDHYGIIRKSTIRAKGLTYTGQASRNAQNSEQIYQCLLHSLTEAAQNKVTVEANEYMLPDLANNKNQPNGPLFLKHILSKTRADTNATVTTIRMRLGNLSKHLQEMKYNISEFNTFVKNQVNDLTSRGQTTHDLLHNLFQAYKTVDDKDFVDFIRAKQREYNKGDELTAEQLMMEAENEYLRAVETEEWQQPTAEQEKIVALSAQVADLKKENEELAKEVKKTQGKGGNNNRRQRNGKGQGQRQNNRQGNRKQGKNNRRNSNIPAPKPGEPLEKEVNGKTLKYCAYKHGWCGHTEHECELKKKEQQSRTGNQAQTQANNNNNNNKPTMKVSSALTAIMEEEASDF